MKENERQAIQELTGTLSGTQFGNVDQIVAAEKLSVKELRELAGREIESTVGPWSQEFVESGLYGQILTALGNQKIGDRNNIYRVSLSDEIVFPNKQKLFTGWFNIDANKDFGSKRPVVNIGVNPLFGMSFAAAILYRNRDLVIDLTYPGDLLSQAHPILTLEFAEQIKSGNVWKQIERSLTPGRPRTATLEERQQYDASRRKLSGKYLAKCGKIK